MHGDALIRYVEHFETGGDAVLRSACRMSLEGIVSKRLDAPYRSGRGDGLDQGQMPRRPRGGDRRLEHDQGQASARCWSASIAATISSMSAASAPASARERSKTLLPRLKALAATKSRSPAGAPRKAARRPLAEARAGGRDRVRRLDRRRHGAPGGVQGPARGQAGGEVEAETRRRAGTDRGQHTVDADEARRAGEARRHAARPASPW